MRLLLDEMLPPAIAVELRARGHDVEAVAARLDLVTQEDPVIFAAAQTEGRVVVTENIGDFRLLAANALGRGVGHHGLMLAASRRFRRGSASYLGHLVRLLDAIMREDAPMAGREVWLRLPEE